MRFWLLVLMAWSLHATATIRVQDDAGRQVQLAQAARRVVALAPHIAENLYAAGATDVLVGTVSYADYPDAAQQVLRVGSFNSFSIEAIAATNPDLIIMWGSGNGLNALAALETLNVPVYISEPRTLAGIGDNLRRLGKLTGHTEQSNKAATLFEQGIDELRRKHRDARKLDVLFQIWHQPLQTIGSDHLISQVIKLCGANNAFADTTSLAPKLNIESILARDPDAIIASGAGKGRPPWLDDWRKFTHLRAVKRDALYYVNPDHLLRHTPRLLLGATALCHKLELARQVLPSMGKHSQ